MNNFFFEKRFCPFCSTEGSEVTSLRYYETSEFNSKLPDVRGQIIECNDCGIYYPSISFEPEIFIDLYNKSFEDLLYFNNSFLQNIRLLALTRLILSQLSGPLSSALQIPPPHVNRL